MYIDTPTVIYVVLDVILALIVILGNLLVIFVILQSALLRRKAMYICVTALALADIWVGLTAIPFGILTKFGLPNDSPSLCVTMLSFIMISTQTSIFTMTAIAVERYLAIRHPRIHYTKLTPSRSVYVIALTWIVASLVGCLPLLGWNKIQHSAMNSNSNEKEHIDDAVRNASSVDEKLQVLRNNKTYDWEELLDDNNTRSIKRCQFMEIMDENYMFFNFTVCVLPPLITCAALYFIIFLSLSRTSRRAQSHQDYNNFSLTHGVVKTPVPRRKRRQRLTEGQEEPYKMKYNNQSKKVKILISLGADVSSSKVCHKCGMFDEIESTPQSCGPTIPVESSSRNLAMAERESIMEKEVYSQRTVVREIACDGRIKKRLKRLALEEIKRKKLSHLIKYKSDTDSQTDAADSVKSSCMSTPILTRSASGTTLNLELSKKKLHHCKSKKEIHAATVLGLIVLCFVICWTPIHILNTIHRFDHNQHVYIPTWLYDVGVLLSHTNSAVNFFLYSWRLKAFRKQLHRLIHRKVSR